MIAYIIGYISLVVVPLLCIWCVCRKLSGVPHFWTMLKRAALVTPFALWGAIELCALTQFVGLHPGEVTHAFSAAKMAFWAAGLPEEMAKLFIIVLLLWWNYRKGISIDTKTILICACMVGALFGMYENLFNSYPHAGKFLSRHWAFIGHFCYSMMMGYGCSLFFNMKNKTLYAQIFIYCLLLPTVMHAWTDFCVFTLPISTGLKGKAMFLFGDLAAMMTSVWIARRCIKRVENTRQSEQYGYFVDDAEVSKTAINQ